MRFTIERGESLCSVSIDNDNLLISLSNEYSLMSWYFYRQTLELATAKGCICIIFTDSLLAVDEVSYSKDQIIFKIIK